MDDPYTQILVILQTYNNQMNWLGTERMLWYVPQCDPVSANDCMLVKFVIDGIPQVALMWFEE